MDMHEEAEQFEGIAIIGMSGRFPGASDIHQFWRNLCDGAESISTFTDDQLLSTGENPALINSSGYVKAGALLQGIDLFDAEFFGFTPREAEATDPQHRIFLECAWEAMENAGYNPDQYRGRIGVFGGASMLCSYRDMVRLSPRLNRMLGDLQTSIGVERDFLTTRVSYKLNLKGPSITVQTACSTSLVAVHLGCQSLLNGESDMVLAGGVCIRIAPTAGYLYQEGSILSPDGHCRAFDAMAQGTVFGSGVGIVVLKRLADALSDGDCIHAVIRGSSINNDGALKVGFTAPSVDGQAAVIAEAQAIAGVTGDEITYVEAHGTGTKLGDPIEVAALTKAFRRTTQNKTFCALGSVKTNIGHLDAAAGVAGLIKVTMALQNRTLPASLNFKQPNPAIDFASSPFYVQEKLSDWRPRNGRRVAGVSSFGIGGTNAHVVVEEATGATRFDPSRPWQLLTLSARSPEALEKGTDRLVECLSGRTLNLADVAFTLQLGRKAFAHRRFVAVDGIEDSIRTLRARDSKRIHTARTFDAEVTVAFMFPAQGAQHVDMGRDLYATEPIFRECVDRCADYLQPSLGTDLRRILYQGDDVAQRDASEQLRQTRFTQPAVFTIDYALAQLWMSWGIMPSAMVGHSLGEYVAATLSGVLELEDALLLVAERARLMQALPPGNMLVVHLSEEQLQPWLSADVSLAALNAPSLSVISGPAEAIDRVAEALQARHVEVQPLRTSHAFHSAMMEPMIAPFVDRVAHVRRSPPRIPFISTLTGTWISAEQAMEPAYWGRQTRRGVRFSAAVQELLKTPARVLLEVGPGNTLSALAKLQLKPGLSAAVVNSLRHAKEERSDQNCVLTALGCLWTAGVVVDWSRLYVKEHRQRVPLPTYPFERKRFWITTSTSTSTSSTGQTSTSGYQSGVIDSVPKADASLYSRPDVATSYAPPITKTEQKLAGLWQRVLGVEVGIHDDFFELGGHSLLAVTLMGEVERIFGSRLPLAALIQAPTVQQFAALLAEKESTPSWSSLVTLNADGRKPPLFLMHSHGGNVLEYQPLARRLGKERPLYALQARGLNGHMIEEPRIEEMASHYLQEIRSVQAHGPYYIGGFCFGGFLALEAAHQLRAQGEAVALVILINTSTRDYANYPAEIPRALQFFYRSVYRCALEWSGVSGKQFREICKYAVGRVRRLREISQARVEMLLDRMLTVLGRPVRRHSMTYQLERLAMAHDRAWAAYDPRSYDGRVILLYAKRQPLGILVQPTLGWAGLLTGDIEVMEVPGFRQNMLDEPNVAVIATVLLDALRACDQVELDCRVPA